MLLELLLNFVIEIEIHIDIVYICIKLFKDEKVTLTRIDYPRAARLEDFPKEAQKEFEYKENFEEAYTSLKNKLQVDDMLLVTGSFYLVGAVLNYCKRGKDES